MQFDGFAAVGSNRTRIERLRERRAAVGGGGPEGPVGEHQGQHVQQHRLHAAQQLRQRLHRVLRATANGLLRL